MAQIYLNAILVGPVDYFCLACETYLKNKKDAYTHIANPVHHKELEAVQYVEEFKGDGIKKIKNKYFCEFCNKLLNVLARVRLHVFELTHIGNKNARSLKRIGNSVIAFDKVVICDESWNGLFESSCALCNIEYEDESIHRNLSTHILNVIQTQVEFDGQQNIYRKIDEVSFHCLTCNMVLAINSLTSHFVGDNHKTLYQACCDAYNKMIPVDTQSEEIPDFNKTPEEQVTSSESVLLHSEKKVHETEAIIKESPKIDPTFDKAQSDNKEGVEESVNGTIKVKKHNTQSGYVYEEDTISKNLGYKDYVTCDENNMTWCILCGLLIMPGTIISHVNGSHHKTMYMLHKERLKKQDSNISDIDKVETQDEVADDILDKLNEIQDDGIYVNFELNTALCKKCNTHIEFVYKVIKAHILEHNKAKAFDSLTDTVSDTKETLFENPVIPERNDEENKTHKKNKSESDAEKLDSVRVIKPSKILETLSLKNEKVNVSMKKTKTANLLRMPLNNFTQNAIVAINNDTDQKDIIINKKYCINYLSFWLMAPMGPSFYRCYLCQERLDKQFLKMHCKTLKHHFAWMDVAVIVNDDSEFLREYRSGCFHCGFCNFVETSWERMEVHLKSSLHKECKNTASWRKEIYLTQVAEEKYKRLSENILEDPVINQFF